MSPRNAELLERQAMNEERTIMYFTVFMIGLVAAVAAVVAFLA
ncbi:hypothetical protein [Mycolicibacter minnesotensis]|nr:hypothetical protein [Mycolicibacter minnesotensis]